jgi:hypothetical protein
MMAEPWVLRRRLAGLEGRGAAIFLGHEGSVRAVHSPLGDCGVPGRIRFSLDGMRGRHSVRHRGPFASGREPEPDEPTDSNGRHH